MDTKWNGTDKGPEEALEQFAAGQVQKTVESAAESDNMLRTEIRPERTRQVKAVIGFLAFFLGLSLLLGSLGAIAGRLAWERGSSQWWNSDWQKTSAFRSEVSTYLKEFLTLAAGGELNWYDSELIQVADYSGTTVFDTVVTSTPLEASEDDAALDSHYQNDKNVLYRIRKAGSAYSQSEWYSNTDGIELGRKLPEGYNFLLTFANGKVSIFKDGLDLDVYGDGVYSGKDQWFVPGYDNFPAGDGVGGAVIYMAVRETPVQYYTRNSANNYYSQNSRMYYVYQSYRESQSFYVRQAVLLGLGLLWLAVYIVFRRETQLAARILASWTVHVWTEARFLVAALSLACLLLPRVGSVAQELWWEVWYGGSFHYVLPYIGRALIASLENTAALLCLVWVVWLIHNDHRYHPKSERRSLLRKLSRAVGGLFQALRMRDLERPIQKRLARDSMMGLAAMVLLLALTLPFLLKLGWELLVYSYQFDLWHLVELLLLAFDLALILSVIHTWQSRRLPRDIGLLADQVEAIRGGDLSLPLELPEDADLHQTAEALNDIQAGMQKALAEQTRSERMKVELISNVSHDLKTPLTSILSYAELLRQEPLEGAAADYARIIDEKAQRLKVMVQDVFEVSKAAADQLPVQLERLDLAKLLRQTLADMDDPIQSSRLTFKIDLPDEPVMIVADGKRLYRVFQNLIQNALQYALEGSRVYLSLKTGAGKAEASLRNTSRSELPEGVDFTARFVRGDESRTDGGSGLGLSIASSFTEACGGEFRVETVADLFTAVVTFPLVEAAAP